MTSIALFGTSADPPTAAHQAILRWLAQHYDVVAVWASDNPFKSHQTSLDHRAEMLRLIIQELETPEGNIKLYQELSDRRSLISLEKAKQIWGEKPNYSLVIGSDLISQIHKWYRIKELLAMVTILVIPRPGYPVSDQHIEGLQSLGAKCILPNLKTPPLSSTAYRHYHDKNVVTKSVASYIDQEKLYA